MEILTEESSSFEKIADILHEGGIVCYPTETFYALGADPWNALACEKLYQLKRRSAEKELPLIAADIEMVSQVCDISDPRFSRLAESFWPGPLSIVLPAIDHSRTYAIRVSSNAAARRISRLFGKPIISTSANLSAGRPVRSPDELNAELIAGIHALLDAGVCQGGLPSTIVSLTQPQAEILREGAIPSQRVLSLL